MKTKVKVIGTDMCFVCC